MSSTLEEFNLSTSSYGFSGAQIDDLGASEYTLVTIAVDESSSVSSFKDELEKCLSSIVEACRKSPRCNFLMLRLIAFGNGLREVHGFKELQNCNPGDYQGAVNPGGMTALCDATVNAIEAAAVYGKNLVENDFECNGLLVVVTDGMENNSTNTTNQAKEALKQVQLNEHIDGGLHTILIGVNEDPGVHSYLEDFKKDVGFAQEVHLVDASPETLAKVANFVSRSTSAQSQSLATGGPSQSVGF